MAVVTLARPGSLNALNPELVDALRETVLLLERHGARCLLLTGEGRGFSSGADLAGGGGLPEDVGATLEAHFNPLMEALSELPIPVVTAVNGVAAGAGANIALACDVVIAARSAKFIQSFANIGLIPDSGGTWVLPRLVGQARALGLALTGEPLSAEKAEGWGMIWACVDDDALDAEATALAERFASGPTRGLAATKRLIRGSWGYSLDAELDYERDAMRELGFSDDYREGVAAFAAKRPAAFTGR